MLVPGRSARAQLKVRENITAMAPDKIARFRTALAEVMARRDNRGYQFFAGWHGVPFQLCWHHHPYFLPWHRGYLYHFELALQDVEADVTLPWWDWSTATGSQTCTTGRRSTVVATSSSILRSSRTA